MEDAAVTPRKWYRSREHAQDDGWPSDLDGVRLSLFNYQTLGDIMMALLKADPLRDGEEARRVALAAFKAQSEMRGGKWEPRRIYRMPSGVTFANPRAPQAEIEHAVERT